MVDPGFPIGGRQAIGGTDLQQGHFLAKMYVKTKELDPVGGRGRTPAAPPVCDHKEEALDGI